MGVQVAGRVSVTGGSDRLLGVVASTTGAPLLPPGGTTTGGTGSYLESLIIQIQVTTTVGSCQVQLGDGNQGTVTVFPNVVAGTTTLMNNLVYQVDIGAVSQFGPWKVTTGGNVTVTAVGRFVK